MMRRSLTFFLALVFTGVTSCMVGGYFFIRTFQTGDCDGGCNISTLASWVAVALMVFLLAGFTLKQHRAKRGKSPYPALAVLAAVAVTVPGLLYLAKSTHTVPLEANQDDSYMLMAERDIPALHITAGQRCIFSTIDCSTQPAHINAVCAQGPAIVTEPDWPAFKRLPQEDFGIPPPEAVRAFPKSCPRPE